MKPKIFTLFAALTLSAGALFASGTYVDGIYYDFDDAKLTATVTYRGSYYDEYTDEYTGKVVIPATVTCGDNTYSVTSIGEGAFGDCSGLTSITIPNSVTSIGDYAFAYCSGLNAVAIPNSVTSIGKEAFAYCSGLTSVTIGNSVTSIGKSAFEGCSGLTSVTIPNSVTSIGGWAFEGCSGLKSVTIPNSVTSIGKEAFAGTKWFANQPDGVIYINQMLYTYKGEMPANTSIVVRDGTTQICESAFDGCSDLTSVTIPDGVTSIGRYAFWDCSTLTSVTIPNSVTSIGEYAFAGTAWLANQSDGVIYINQLLYTYKGEMPANTSIVVRDGTIQICESAFEGCSTLTSVTIPNSVTSIGEYAFYNCSGLTSVTIGNSVTSIGSYAFRGCSGLTSVTIPNSVTSIGEYAFYKCSSLTSVTIGNSVTSIGEYAFEECTQLTNIVCYAAEPPSCDASSFANYDASLKVPYSSLEAYKAAAVWRDFNNISYIESTVGLEQIELAGLYTQAGRIVCEGEFRIYDLLGRDVTRLNGSLYGVYVVKTANAAVKVVVR